MSAWHEPLRLLTLKVAVNCLACAKGVRLILADRSKILVSDALGYLQHDLSRFLGLVHKVDGPNSNGFVNVMVEEKIDSTNVMRDLIMHHAGLFVC